ncbi:hypothetical protein [Phaeodactylibacter luteus]|uniref:Uncharacterized protein n=1 Tax=Phaeodactylibacter luteus TaxID=1564516 RepID=A0A5C6S1Q1_9BACT|nr:hypothetical protein [Phaeodactylibacter luteus]TXB68313.1 hypothetical protein FRY97_02735 [Phaeodactylibacter luteus]
MEIESRKGLRAIICACLLQVGGIASLNPLLAQEAAQPDICFCKNNDSVFEQELIRALSINLVAIQQDFLPVDSFGITWSAENRPHPLPFSWGVAVGADVIVFSPALSPWQRDTFFRLNQAEYYWEKGQLTSAYFYSLSEFGADTAIIQQDTIQLDTLGQGAFAYQGVGWPNRMKVASLEALSQYLLYFELVEAAGYRLCLLPIAPGGEFIILSNKVQGGLVLVAETSPGNGEINFGMAGYLLPVEYGGARYRFMPYAPSMQK